MTQAKAILKNISSINQKYYDLKATKPADELEKLNRENGLINYKNDIKELTELLQILNNRS